jgi:hypothetical protein
MIEIEQTISYRGRAYVVVGVTSIGVTPCLVDLEDADSGRLRRVECDDPER